ncbi:Acyl-CoA dehydrogenase [Collimonas sp. OK307]|uniref:acyl-CoA dehydrogenase family protein n=1 Tax=Collimonas sp. OK307 TaxID=1801620 RepID=UPI0008E3F63E|nr:acyl-CoA dehydrogenase family protein [Collimonas sp. OK307]SFI00375.1 Acyl-CoA dehydrogenase [Collimonas sp. OK307]
MRNQIVNHDQDLAVTSFRKFLEAEIRPIVKEYRDRFIPKEKMREITQSIADFGLPGGAVPVAHGGMGLPWTTQAMLFEELATVSCDIALVVMVNLGAVDILLQGSDEIGQRYLPALLAGRIFAGMGINQLGVDSHLIGIDIVGERSGDCLILNGEKKWITNGVYSDFLICPTHTRQQALSYILVDRSDHGYEARNIEQIGLASQSTAQIFISNARVPLGNIIVDEYVSSKNRIALFKLTCAYIGLLSVGLMRAALADSIVFASDGRKQDKSIARHQLIAGKIADMTTLADAARLLCFHAFDLIDADVDSDVELSMAQLFSTETAVKVCHDTVQLHGENGVAREFNFERYLRDALIIPVLSGPAGALKN